MTYFAKSDEKAVTLAIVHGVKALTSFILSVT